MDEEFESNPLEEIRIVNVWVEVYLRNRTDSILVATSIPMLKMVETVDEAMDIALSLILEQLDTRGEFRIVLGDERFNKRIFLLDEIQSISLLAPDSLGDDEDDLA